MPDPNPIIDEGNPTSTAGIESIIRLCEILDRDVILDKPRARYRRGWGPAASDSAEIVASWCLYLQDMKQKTVAIIFDVTEDNSPVVIGMDIKKFSKTDNLSNPPHMMIRRPEDKGKRFLETYIKEDDPLKTRLRLLVTPTGI